MSKDWFSKEGAMKTKQIRFSVDKNGKEIAYEWRPKAMRYVKVSLDSAKFEIATGSAVRTEVK